MASQLSLLQDTGGGGPGIPAIQRVLQQPCQWPCQRFRGSWPRDGTRRCEGKRADIPRGGLHEAVHYTGSRGPGGRSQVGAGPRGCCLGVQGCLSGFRLVGEFVFLCFVNLDNLVPGGAGGRGHDGSGAAGGSSLGEERKQVVNISDDLSSWVINNWES